MTDLADRDVLRTLAAEVAEIAREPVQQERIRLWTALNDLAPERPMLWITEIPWGEFEDAVDDLRPVCRDARCRGIEQALRRRRFTARHLPCDEVERGVFDVPKIIRGAGYGLETREQQIAQGASYVQSHRYDAVLADLADVDRIRMPRVRFDAEATDREAAFVHEQIGDLLPVACPGIRQHFFPAWDQLVRWTGVDAALIDLVDRPDFLHAIMRRMTDAFLARMDQLAAGGLLDDTRPLARVGSGAAGWTSALPRPDADPARLRPLDQWGGATAQILGSVSPAMHEEFALRYEIEVMARCGLNYYGCCEPLDQKMGILAAVPRLRKVSISPWCDPARAAETATRRYVFSHKPSPAILAGDRFDAGLAEQDLRDRIARSHGMPCEVILKDISTVRGDVERLKAWCRMAHRVVRGG
jgi:hypothetical protein